CLVGFGKHEEKICTFLRQHSVPAFLVLNKIDLIEKDKLLALITTFQQENTYQDVLLISATQGKGVDGLLKRLEAAMPESPFLFAREQISDMPERLLAAEVVREHLFDRLHQELPYALTVVPEQWQEYKDGSVHIALCILVQKSGHKGIVIGQNGATLKAIGTAARKELSQILKRGAIHLKLYVKVSARWQEDSGHYQTWGLNFDAS
ncbi:MAG: GTPase Era, partial [Alphaproteobacteria bacterium]|nr:GTPase Era [Alphaproteobacteria bacterium]